jgi:hypothetical protein
MVKQLPHDHWRPLQLETQLVQHILGKNKRNIANFLQKKKKKKKMSTIDCIMKNTAGLP